MKNYVKIVYLGVGVLFLVYLVLPSPEFPAPPPDSIQSVEPADSETQSRRAYFTDFTREEVMNHYRNLMIVKPIDSFILRLNYPPEDAQTLIRDQTRSTFLEELTYPLRDSLFVNGFEPKDPKDEIWYHGRHFRQKITVRFVPNVVFQRVIVALGIATVSWLIFKEYAKS